MTKKPWQMTHSELIEFCATIVESYHGDPEAVKKAASEIRSHTRKWKLTKQEVYDCHLANPEWTARQIAEHLDCTPEFVHQCADRGSWSPRRLTADEIAKNRAGRFTKDGVLKVHQANPNWTAREIADALGCDTKFVYDCAKRDGWAPRRVTKAEVSFINRQNSSRPRPTRRTATR